MASISCSIANTHFTILKLDNFFTLTETNLGETCNASIQREALVWLHDETKKIGADATVGHLERFKTLDSTLSLSIRKSPSGLFAALMIVDKRAEKKITTVCIPIGQEGSGIVSFSSFIGNALSMKNGTHQAKRNISLFNSEEEAMKATCVIATFSSESYDWNLLPGDLFDMFDIVKAPPIEPIGGNCYLLSFDSNKEVELIMFSKKMTLWDCKISFERWNPQLGTLPTLSLLKSTRWITMYGLPCHLRNKFFLLKLCKVFGKVVDIKSTRGRLSNLTALQVCLEHCDLSLMPQIIPVKDNGTVFPITLSPFMPEFKCIVEEQFQGKNKGKPLHVDVPDSPQNQPNGVKVVSQKHKASSSTIHCLTQENSKILPIHKKHVTKMHRKPANSSHSSASTEPAFYHKPTPSYSPRFPSHVTNHSPLKHHIVDSSTEDEDDQDIHLDNESLYQDSLDDGNSTNSDMIHLASTLGMSLQATDHVFKSMVALKKELLAEMDEKINKGMEDIIESLGAIGVNG